MTNVTIKKQMPLVHHWAIVTYVNTCIEGDERSRTNPGHGYPAHTISTTQYAAFVSEQDWKEKIELYEEHGIPYSAMRVMPAVVSKRVDITWK